MTCRGCGAAVEPGGNRRLWNVNGSGPHYCECIPEIPDVIECSCGREVLRYSNGGKENHDGTHHECQPRPRPRVTAPKPQPRVVPNAGGVIDL
jgi:hypothetical protein